MRAALLSMLLAASCAAPQVGDAPSPGVRFDHLVLFAPDASLQAWLELHFTEAEALETRHDGQGTRGRYFLFLNSFLEVLTLEDEAEARRNEAAFGSDYVVRWKGGEASPIAVGLTFDAAGFEAPPLAHHRYRADETEGGYVMAAGNAEPRGPLVYGTGPERAYPVRSSISEVDAIEDPGRRADVRRYLTHPSGALRLTEVVLRGPAAARGSRNVDLVESLPRVSYQSATEHGLVLEFDGGRRGIEARFPGRPSVVLRY